MQPDDFDDRFESRPLASASPPNKWQPDGANDDAKAEIERLINLDPIGYELQRTAAASKLKIRLEALDQLYRDRQNTVKVSSGAWRAAIVEIWPEPVDGTELLNQIEKTFQRFCHLPEHAAPVLSVWSLMTYCYTSFEFAGPVVVWSPEPECGKGRVLDVTEAVAFNAFRTANTSAAVIYHTVGKGNVTVLIDEFDSQNEEQREAISNVLKSGFQSNGKAHRMTRCGDVQTVLEFSTYSPKMIASIGLDTLDKATRTRAFSIRMSRKPRTVKLEKFRRFKGDEIRSKCARWVQDNAHRLKLVEPLELDECGTDRQEDVWEPLIVLARVAGGDWESRLRIAARAMSGRAASGGFESLGHSLLKAMIGLLERATKGRMATVDLLKDLNSAPEFADLNHGRGVNSRLIAKLLSPYGVSSRDVRLEDERVLKGYDLVDFSEARNYVSQPSPDDPKRYSATKPANIDENALLQCATDSICSVSTNCVSINNDRPCSVVAFENDKEARDEDLI